MNDANAWGADFYLSIHHNAGINGGKGGGIVAIVHTKASEEEEKWQKELYDALIEATGGIVQGMSGSPIIQDGKLIGAVTHVLIDDPTMGYGIFIENMLNSAERPMAKAS